MMRNQERVIARLKQVRVETRHAEIMLEQFASALRLFRRAQDSRGESRNPAENELH